MAKVMKKQHEKASQLKTCDACDQLIKAVTFMKKGKMKNAKECGCGIFVGNKKVG